MTAHREARTVLEDLPEVETLSPEEMARIYGAGLARLGLEALEARDLMSASPLSTLSAGVLHIGGSPGVDNVRILQTNSASFSVEYQLNLHSTPTGTQPSQDIKETWNLNQVQQIDLDGPAGSDRLWMVGSQLPDIFVPIGQQEELAVGGKMDLTNATATSVDNLPQTLVMQTYNDQGHAVKAALGNMTGPETNAPGGGRIARFEHGAIIANSAGTFTLAGAIGDEYVATANESSVYGPGSVQSYLGKCLSVSDSVVQFDNGAIYYSKATGAHVVYGAIYTQYQQMSQTLGLPANDGVSVGSNTLAVRFQNGYLTWMKTAPGVNGVHAVLGSTSATGSMGEEYAETNTWLGAATGDPVTLPGTSYTAQAFQHGVIFSPNQAGHSAVSVDLGAWNFYARLSAVQQSTLGIPVADSHDGAVSGLRITHFSHGGLLQFQGVVTMMNGPMWDYYKSMANQTDPTTGKLYQVEIGAPVQNTLTNANGSAGSMLFQFGSLGYNASGGHVLAGPIYTEYLKTSSMMAGNQTVQAALGQQVSSIQPAGTPGTWEVVFQGGVITWSRTGGAHVALT